MKTIKRVIGSCLVMICLSFSFSSVVNASVLYGRNEVAGTLGLKAQDVRSVQAIPLTKEEQKRCVEVVEDGRQVDADVILQKVVLNDSLRVNRLGLKNTKGEVYILTGKQKNVTNEKSI